MSFAFLPLYTGDYLRDTRHLSPLKHGIYLLLLMHCWDQKGPLPLDEQECAGIANCRSADEIESLRYVVRRFFVRMDDGLYNERMQEEIERANAISLKRKSAGAKGYQAKAKHLRSKSQASATTLTPTPTLTLTPTRKPIAPSRAIARSAQPIGEGELVAELPSRTGPVPVHRSFVKELVEAYPAVMVGQEIDRAKLWLEANPTKVKTNVRRFLTNWMSRQQERGGSR